MAKQTLDIARYRTLSQLLDQALELLPSARDGWLDALAPEFDDLKPQLRRMLSRARVETGDFLKTLPKFIVDADADIAEPAEQPGDVVGAYELERELGSGGMGVVWLAHRTDGLIRRPVALKLPHGAWKRAGLADRMARERDILATLTHPNIARLYDAGVTAAGQPYLAIEYIEGRRIDEYCRDLDLRTRLELFAQAANAVAYAHGKLVVHRDLKPANILVTDDGQVHLLDFGIAKLLEDGEARATRFTEMSGQALTPDYASPEQILGEPLTIASDVYSLGVVLYELLCDQRPYKMQRDSRGALEDAILQADPSLPSDLVDAKHRAALRGDLDTVALKALKKNPSDRYPTVHALLEDIQRHLDDRPVLAQRDSRWYRTRKFIARNKLPVSAAAAVFVALFAGVVLALWQAHVARVQEARAQEVQAFITSVFSEASPMEGSEGKILSAAQLLHQAERRLNERDDVSPALRVELLAIIGESLFSLEDTEESARVIEEALRLQKSIVDADPEMTARLHLALSHAREMTGEIEIASAELAQSVAIVSSAHITGPVAVRTRLHESAMGLTTGDYATAERAAKQVISEATAQLGPRSDEVAMALMFLSKAYIFTERAPEAVVASRQGLDILLANHHNDRTHAVVFEYATYYASALIHVGDFEAASKVMQESLDNARKVFGADSGVIGDLAAVAVPAELERGELDAALSLARRALDDFMRQAAPDTFLRSYRVRVVGLTLLAVRDPAAVSTLEEAAALAEKVTDPAPIRANLGLALAYAGRLDEADEQLGLAVEKTEVGSYHHLRAQRHRGTLRRLESRSSDAVPLLEQAAAGFAKDRAERGDRAVALVELGLAKLDLEDFAAAESSFTQAEVALTELQQNRMTPTHADLLIGRSRIRLQRGEAAQALPELQRVDSYWRERQPASRWAGEAALWLGRAQLALGQRAEARDALSRAVKLLGNSKLPADRALMKLTNISS